MTGDPSNQNYLPKLVKLATITTVFSLLVPLGPSTVSAESNLDGKFFIGDKSIPIENLQPTDLAPLLRQDWLKFDRYVKETPVMFSGQTTSIYWHPMISFPIPTHWPPRMPRSLTYYIYAEYAESSVHGISYSRSLPWAKVVLTENEAASYITLRGTIGPAIHGEGSTPINREMADRLIQIDKDGRENMPRFVTWKSIPDSHSEIKAIKEYYCQWMIKDRTFENIKKDHLDFISWLNCPVHRDSAFPVLGY